jgi:hypothetical protein
VAFNKIYQIASDRTISFKDLIRLVLKIRGKKRIFISVPASIAKMLGKFFQKTQKVPLFTAEHVKGVLQDSNLDTKMIRQDLGDHFTRLDKAMRFTLEEIGNNWEAYLKPRAEKLIRH